MENLNELIKHLEKGTRVLESPRIKEAFKKINRKDFVGADYEVEAYEDYPLPIGFGQTISQPTTVAFMLELLEPRKGEKILDLGSGSGWLTALLGELVGPEGEVYGVEILPELLEIGRKNLKKYGFKNAEIFPAGDALGLPEHAPFDKIIVSAEAKHFPDELLKQLKKEKGVMVLPWQGSLWKVKKDGKEIKNEEYSGFSFVPLIEVRDEQK